jgi:hypothetical protein
MGKDSLLTTVKSQDNKDLFADELSKITNTEDLRLGAAKRSRNGEDDGRTVLCFPKMRHLANIRLVLKRMEVKDELSFDLRRAEAMNYMAIRGCKHLVRLFSCWGESGSRSRKSLILLFEEVSGSSLETAFKGVRVPESKALRYIHDAATGLAALHAANMTHGALRPRNMFRNLVGTVVLDSPARVVLDATRTQLGQEGTLAMLTGQSMYWSPELFAPNNRSPTSAMDVWALGLTFFELLSGVYPFEGSLKLLLTGLVRWELLAQLPRVRTVVKRMLCVSPDARCTAAQVIAAVQGFFAVDCQRVWRGYRVRKYLGITMARIARVQALVRGMLTRKEYYTEKRMLAANANLSALELEAASGARFSEIDYQIMLLQAVILRKRYTAAMRSFRSDVTRCQAFVRGFIARRWYASVLETRRPLEHHLLVMHESKQEHLKLCLKLAKHFRSGALPPVLQHLATFDDYEHSLGEGNAEDVFMTAEARMKAQVASLTAQLEDARSKISWLLEDGARERAERERVERELGPKYPELQPMVDALTANLKRVADMCLKARTLPISILQHSSFSSTPTDIEFDPQNMCESILQYNDRFFRAERPVIDFNLSNGKPCFVSELLLAAGRSAENLAPAFIEIFTSFDSDRWAHIATAPCKNTDDLQTFFLPGEQIASYLRIGFRMNTAGGPSVVIRYASVKGMQNVNNKKN